MSHPIQTGNILLILVGVALVLSGPYITYRTVLGLKKKQPDPGKAAYHAFSNALNFLIAVLFFVAGILFIVNNLRGNPLA